ncbi:hypothetical protein G3569_11865 [Aliifodinibius halophilus]|uniref:DUF1579 domain-containing protein n=1 Tax=Fodinibius halophilus TaxID=1736908 RepID=A0A6M1TKL6_9BACT|nr:hypothetical protein [Fodinibius halophilus]
MLLFTIVGINFSVAQQSLNELSPPEYFDFWIGDWELRWGNSDGTIGKGTNNIEKILDGKVIKENFKATEGAMTGYVGKSYSVYNSKTGKWKQTWVDNQGAYLDFTGRFKDEQRIFRRETTNEQGDQIIQRMVFYKIKKDSFMWRWEKSEDNGKNWEILWKIAYRRH